MHLIILIKNLYVRQRFRTIRLQPNVVKVQHIHAIQHYIMVRYKRMFMLTQYKIKKCKNLYEISLHNFPYAVVKGEMLSIQAYNKLAQRHVGDIDILLPRNKLSTIENSLINAGFTNTAKTRSFCTIQVRYLTTIY